MVAGIRWHPCFRMGNIPQCISCYEIWVFYVQDEFNANCCRGKAMPSTLISAGAVKPSNTKRISALQDEDEMPNVSGAI